MTPQDPTNNQLDDGKYGIKFTIPDKPPAEQLEMVRHMRQVMETLAQVTGETETLDLSEFDKVIAKLEKKISKPIKDKGGM